MTVGTPTTMAPAALMIPRNPSGSVLFNSLSHSIILTAHPFLSRPLGRGCFERIEYRCHLESQIDDGVLRTASLFEDLVVGVQGIVH